MSDVELRLENGRLTLRCPDLELNEPRDLSADDFERFRRRKCPWADYNAAAKRTICEKQLEEGDHLLRWGEEGRTVRFCHFADDAEVERWIGSLPLEPITRYDADGREGTLNRYFVLRMRGES